MSSACVAGLRIAIANSPVAAMSGTNTASCLARGSLVSSRASSYTTLARATRPAYADSTRASSLIRRVTTER